MYSKKKKINKSISSKNNLNMIWISSLKNIKKAKAFAKIMFKFRMSRYKSFKVDTILNFVSNLIFLIGTILFWYVIDDAGFIVAGWNYNELLVFIALSEMFYGFEQNVFSVASVFWNVIYSGVLDTQLVRPIDSRKRFMLLNTDYIGLLISFVKVAAILIYAGIYINPLKFVFGILVIFMANYVLMLIRFIICYASFWGGKMNSLTEICDSFTKFNKYPLVIFPKAVRIIFQTILPFYFFSTFSAEIILNKLTVGNSLIMFGGLVLNIILWSLINKKVWNVGREHYESIGG